MGCDIHIAIQVQGDDGVWAEVPWQTAPYDDVDAVRHPLVNGVAVAPGVFDGRNYDLFGILADVRNGRGFAGVKTGDGWPAIAADRGWPIDAMTFIALPDPRWPQEGARYMGDHSYTWVALGELVGFDWDSVGTTLCSVVTAEQYEALRESGGVPDRWSGGVTGPGIRVYDPDGYEQAKRAGDLVLRPFINYSWRESARSATCDWPGQVIPWLTGIAAGRPLRLLLGFDS